jgi:hypothetical protein
MSPAVRTLALAAVALLAPASAAAQAFAWTGQAGVDYQRLDTERAGGGSASYPRLDLNLKLDLGGASPGILSWNAGVGYRRLSASRDGVDDVRDQVSYRLRTTILTNPRSPVSADLHAERSDESTSLEGISSTRYHNTGYGAALRLSPPNRPFLNASYTLSGAEYDVPTLGNVERTVQSLDATTGMHASSYTYRASYRLNRSEGTYALDDYDDHRVDVLADAHVSDATKLTLSDTYYVRSPRETTLARRQELNALSAHLRSGERGRDLHTVTYGYTHGVQTSLTEELERTHHRLSYGLERPFPNREWRLVTQLRVSYADDRVDGTPTRTGGESLGLATYWRREQGPGRRVEVHAGPTVALLHPADADTRLGWGASAGGSINRPVGAVQTSASYDVSYESDVDAQAGWSFSQTALGAATGRLALGTLRGSLQLSAQRRQSPLLGGAATRSAVLTTSYGWSRHELNLQAAIQDGAAGTVSGVQDGLFLAPSYSSHHRSLSFAASTSPWTFLSLRARLRYLVTDLPDRPSTDEKEAYAGVEYVYGSLRFALEDRYVIAGAPGGSTRYNQVFVRAYRAFGARY